VSDLSVWLDQEHVGWLRHDAETNRFAFDYAQSWVDVPRASPISPALPLHPKADLTADAHSADVRQFFENLLPEGAALDHAARAANVSKANLVGLMIALGGETAGAIRVLPEAVTAPAGAQAEGQLRLVTRDELSQRIRDRASTPFSVWDRKVRLAIAGCQDKIAVYERGTEWYLVDGGRLASTLVVKPVPVDPQLHSLPGNEFICMRLADACDLAAATVRLVHVPEPVLLVQRFDRVVEGERVRRLHLIDGCQALGRGVGMKYERPYGSTRDVRHIRDGVSYPKLFELLEVSRQPAVDRQALLQWAIFQALVGNTDGHGKNVSFFYDVEGLRLAPMYDVVCIAALGAPDIEGEYAMAIGDAFTDREVSPYEWANFAEKCRLPVRNVARQVHLLASRVLQELPRVVDAAKKEGVPDETAAAVERVVAGHCKRHVAMATEIGKSKRLLAPAATSKRKRG
jgi:serine/threonine-protein kinase HipA